MVAPQTKRATLRLHLNPLGSWVWIGVFVLIGGASISLWPEVRLREVGVWGYLRATAGAATSIMFAILLATSSARAATPVAKFKESGGLPAPAVMHWDPGALAALASGLLLGGVTWRRRSRRDARSDS